MRESQEARWKQNRRESAKRLKCVRVPLQPVCRGNAASRSCLLLQPRPCSDTAVPTPLKHQYTCRATRWFYCCRQYAQVTEQQRQDHEEAAAAALARRKHLRARHDKLMRKPWVRPASPTKPILKRGDGARLRSCVVARAPHAAGCTAGCTVTSRARGQLPQARLRGTVEAQQRETVGPDAERQNLKQFIAEQRARRSASPPSGALPPCAHALSRGNSDSNARGNSDSNARGNSGYGSDLSAQASCELAEIRGSNGECACSLSVGTDGGQAAAAVNPLLADAEGLDATFARCDVAVRGYLLRMMMRQLRSVQGGNRPATWHTAVHVQRAGTQLRSPMRSRPGMLALRLSLRRLTPCTAEATCGAQMSAAHTGDAARGGNEVAARASACPRSRAVIRSAAPVSGA